MTKRNRESSVTFMVQNDHVVIEYDGKEYSWNPPVNVDVKTFLNTEELEFSVIHNFENKAMLDVENLRENQIILRQEINPLKYKEIDDWMVDE